MRLKEKQFKMNRKLDSHPTKNSPVVLIISLFLVGVLIFNCKKSQMETVFSASLNGIYVYDSPSMTSKIIAKIPFRKKFYLIDKETWNEEWKKIEYNQISGYIYQKEFSFEIPENIVYVDNLKGIKLYEEPDSSKILKVLPHKTKLEILDILDKTADKLQAADSEDFLLLSEHTWLHVKHNQQEGYILLDDSIRIKPKIHYFFVVHPKGLDLHLEPNLHSEIVTNVPKNTIGEILEANPVLEKHGSIEGYWFKTEYKSKVGWGFSGYIVTSSDPNYFEEKDVVYDEEIFINFLSSSEILQNYTPKKIDFKKAKTQNLNNYKILEVNYNYPLEDCSIATNSRIIFQNLRLKEFYSHQEYYEEKILSVGEPFPENVYTEYNGCHCCCGDIGNNLYFLFQDKIQYVNFSLNNSKGKCLHGPGEDFEYYQENRIDKENKVIYSLLKLPVCKVLDDSVLFEQQESESEPVDYSHTLFVVLKVENGHINIEKYYDEDIPNTYKKDWEKLK